MDCLIIFRERVLRHCVKTHPMNSLATFTTLEILSSKRVQTTPIVGEFSGRSVDYEF